MSPRSYCQHNGDPTTVMRERRVGEAGVEDDRSRLITEVTSEGTVDQVSAIIMLSSVRMLSWSKLLQVKERTGQGISAVGSCSLGMI
ncbi:hypothetical protein SRHO_G00129160 [Serrasalmus rhombeus]